MSEADDVAEELYKINSAWKGHENFATWLVNYKQPKVIVDLGMDYGFSTFVFAIPKIGIVYGVDWFQEDQQTPWNTYDSVIEKQKLFKKKFGVEIVVIKGDSRVVCSTWSEKIDILHIDAMHIYDYVKSDYENWSKFVNEDGVILLHDVNSCFTDVCKYFQEIKEPKGIFLHSHGLGVISKNKDMLSKIKEKFNDFQI